MKLLKWQNSWHAVVNACMHACSYLDTSCCLFRVLGLSELQSFLCPWHHELLSQAPYGESQDVTGAKKGYTTTGQTLKVHTVARQIKKL